MEIELNLLVHLLSTLSDEGLKTQLLNAIKSSNDSKFVRIRREQVIGTYEIRSNIFKEQGHFETANQVNCILEKLKKSDDIFLNLWGFNIPNENSVESFIVFTNTEISILMGVFSLPLIPLE